MIINSATQFEASDVQAYAWGRLTHFQNPSHVGKRIIEAHRVPAKHKANAEKQATQIRQCLLQAREYFNAAKSVSLATQPALLYYCAMSLALVEILFKETGESRLEKLREHHGAHGLSFHPTGALSAADDLGPSASALRAKAQLNTKGDRWGTFEVWRKSSREPPLCGYLTTQYSGGGTTTGYRSLFHGSDVEPAPLPSEGITLLDCFKHVPELRSHLEVFGERTELVRAQATVVVESGGKQTFQLIIHPNDPTLIERLSDKILFNRYANLNEIDIRELPSGYILRIDLDPAYIPIRQLPMCFTGDTQTAHFLCGPELLNEFGFLYVGLHICGMFARYFPDKWLRHIERNSALAITVEQFLLIAMDRLPLLCLSELERSLHVRKA